MPCRRQFEWLPPENAQDDKARPEASEGYGANEAKEQGHVDLALVPDVLGQDRSIETIQYGAQQSHAIP